MRDQESTTDRKPTHSFTFEFPPGEPSDARAYFAAKLAFAIDSSDLMLDLERRTARIIVVDARPRKDYDACHVPGAISLPWRTITEASTASLPKDALIVTYCWGEHCNAATKAALKLSALRFRVKEMIGGLICWRHDALPVEGTLGEAAPLYG